MTEDVHLLELFLHLLATKYCGNRGNFALTINYRDYATPNWHRRYGVKVSLYSLSWLLWWAIHHVTSRTQCPLYTPHLYHAWWRQEAGQWYFYVNNGWLGPGWAGWAGDTSEKDHLSSGDKAANWWLNGFISAAQTHWWGEARHYTTLVGTIAPLLVPGQGEGQGKGQGEGQGEDASYCLYIIVSQFPAPGRRRLS